MSEKEEKELVASLPKGLNSVIPLELDLQSFQGKPNLLFLIKSKEPSSLFGAFS
jgi:hypothetical protein